MSEKRRNELPCSEWVLDGMLCVYERLRKIEMKSERLKSSKKGVVVSRNRESGRSKIFMDED